MKNFVLIIILLLSNLVPAQNYNFVGSYWHTEMEYAEQMHILKPHRFSWQAVYGAVNQDFRGKWKVRNDTIHLVFDELPGNQRPSEILAILTDSGDLKMIGDSSKPSQKKSVLNRFDKTLPPKKAAELAKPIDYSKQIAARKAQLKKQKAAAKKRFEKFEKEQQHYGRYHGFFANQDKDHPVVLALNAKRKQFIFKEPKPDKKEQNRYLEGTFTVKNDTAFVTTNSDEDEIQVYGLESKEENKGKMEIYVRNPEAVPLKLKLGNQYSEAKFIRSEKFKKDINGLRHVQIDRTDSLWVVVNDRHIYSFGLQGKNYKKILVQPNPEDSKPWIKRPVYVTKNKEIHALLGKETNLKKVPQKTLIAPVSTPPSYPKLNGKTYFPIKRDRIFMFQKP